MFIHNLNWTTGILKSNGCKKCGTNFRERECRRRLRQLASTNKPKQYKKQGQRKTIENTQTNRIRFYIRHHSNPEPTEENNEFFFVRNKNLNRHSTSRRHPAPERWWWWVCDIDDDDGCQTLYYTEHADAYARNNLCIAIVCVCVACSDWSDAHAVAVHAPAHTHTHTQ